MDDREQQRKVRHRLAVLRHAEEVTGSVSATCRYYGISRQVFYAYSIGSALTRSTPLSRYASSAGPRRSIASTKPLDQLPGEPRASMALRIRSTSPSLGAVARMQSPIATTPAHPGGQSFDAAFVMTCNPVCGKSGAPASSAHIPRTRSSNARRRGLNATPRRPRPRAAIRRSKSRPQRVSCSRGARL
jgi:hypothetical protein